MLRAELKKRLAPLRFLSRAEILTLLALVVQPLVLVLLALVIGAIEYPWILLAWLVQLVVLVAMAGVQLRRRLAARRLVENNPQVTGFLSPGLLEAPAQSASLTGAPSDARITINRLIARSSQDELVAYALHAGTSSVIDALALRTTSGALDLDGLLAVGALAAPTRSRVLGAAEVDGLVGLARAAAIHDLGPLAHERLLDLALDRVEAASDPARVRIAEMCVAAGRIDDAAATLDLVTSDSWQRRLLLADLINPGHADPDADAAWLALANASFRAAGLEPLELADGAGVAFDRLSAPGAVPSSASGPRVTVIMSAFRPDQDTLHAVRAITHQTWRDWELLVMDDASGPEFDDVFERIDALDERIVVVRSEVNRGTYYRRNEALQRATGEFVTMQDSDDWSHPRRLELQVQHLLAHPAIPANVTSALRVSSDLRFTQGRGLYLRLSEPSLMFRRQQVVDRIGYFDSVRKSADSEYRVRIAAAFGSEVPHLFTRGPLMLMRFDTASLSGSDFADGWTHPARVIYRSAYLAWHDAAAGRSGFRMPFPLELRPFAAPTRMVGAESDRGAVDILIVLDARRGGSLDAHRATIEGSIRRVVGAGRRVGLMHSPGFMHGTQEKRLTAAYHRLVNDGVVVEVISRDESVHAGAVVIWGRGAVLGIPETTQITADAVAVVSGSTGADPLVTSAYAHRLAQERFGQPAVDVSPRLEGLFRPIESPE